jgi:hypothetical protein
VKTTLARLCLAVCLLVPMGSTFGGSPGQASTGTTQIAALDKRKPVTLCVALGPEFRGSVALGVPRLARKLQNFFAKAVQGTPDQDWDLEPDFLRLKAGALLSVVNEGGRSHGAARTCQGTNAVHAVIRECA